MIDRALQFLVERLNTHLDDGGHTDRAVVGPVISQDGSIPSVNQNKVIVSVVHIAQVPDMQSFSRQTIASASANMSFNRPLNLNLHVLFAASFNDYREGLHYLSRAIAFLEANPIANENAPGFPAGLEKLILSMADVEYSELIRLWNGLGAKYMPSVLYQMRMDTMDIE